ncbi:MAG: GAF domain-containing protein [Deltaproteobacteria bacterium]|nr:GAF domain-containing protein [Deltaproteobacteria bacterium]MBW2136325.1 GAF domain-containing protein [Deltaproteobacteria bacterium]
MTKHGSMVAKLGSLLEDPKGPNMDYTPRQLREAEQKVRILHEITRFVSSLLDVQLVLDAIVDLLVREFRLDTCSIRLLDPDGKLRIKSHRGLSEKFVREATSAPNNETYSGECFLTGRIVIVNDSEAMEKHQLKNRIVREDIRSFAVSPIKVEGETIGVLVTASRKRDYFHERFNDVIYTITNQIGIAINMSRLYEEIYQLNRRLEQKVRERTAELEQKTQQLIRAERLATIGDLSQRIAHELRNSLTVVGGFARRLYKKSREDDPNREYLLTMMEEVRVLEEKVSNIIKLANGEVTDG